MSLLFALALLWAAPLPADPGLEAEFQAALRSRAQSMSCAAQVLGNPLRALDPGWSFAMPAALPPAGRWQGVAVALRRGPESRTLALQIRLWPCERVKVLARSLPAGAELGEGDLALAWVDARCLGGLDQRGPIAAGSRLVRPRRLGDPLLSGDLAQAPSRRAGDRVRLQVRFPGGLASDEGILLEDAAEGSLIKAEHARSGRVVTGRLRAGAVLVED
jgi:flagella basal body P-ring formation protein FlgA